MSKKDMQNKARVEAVARSIYHANGWTHWPLDSVDPDSEAEEICSKYRNMAIAALVADRFFELGGYACAKYTY